MADKEDKNTGGEESQEDNQNSQPEDARDPEKEKEEDLDSLAAESKEDEGNVANIDIVDDMEESYLSYAMSVIVSRALPDVRDGLKPVHRRILYSMHGLGVHSTAKYRKSAYIVGDVMAKYHPHGDAALYGTMVRMAQDFSMRYELVDGQGNFGSIDGDAAAAMRYTEARMAKISEEILANIEKGTVDFRDNYDGTRKEPCVLPAKIPNLLINGTLVIAVGMATNIPPHNLKEVCEASIHILENPECSLDDLMNFIKGPDFPTGGIIYDQEAIREALVNGRGGMFVRGKAEIEERKGGKYAICISEIPYQVNKAVLVEKIAELVRDKKIIGITDIRDESNRESLRVVVEISSKAYPKKILNQIFKYTPLQTRFNYNMIALDHGIQPKLFNIKTALESFLDHRFEVTTRRIEYEKNAAEKRAHVLEGLKIALDHIDAVIELIRASADKEEASKNLQKEFKLTEIQSEAILAMPLRTLAGLERKKIEDELKEKKDFITECEKILADPQKIKDIIKKELEEVMEKYGDDRRTNVNPGKLGDFSSKDMIPNEEVIISLTKENYIKRMSASLFKAQNRGGKGVVGMTTKDEDSVAKMSFTNNHNDILFFTSRGKAYCLPAYEIPESLRTAKGTPIVNILPLESNETVTEFLDLSRTKGKFLFMCTRKGTVKKVALENFSKIRKNGIIANSLHDDDFLNWVKVSGGQQEVMIVSKKGMTVRFDEQEVRSMGRGAAGVRGIRLKKNNDEVVEMDVVDDSDTSKLLIVAENGRGKMSKITDYRKTKRGAGGVKTMNITDKTGDVVGAKVLSSNIDGDVLLMSKNGTTIRTNIKNIPSRGRATQGVILMRMKSKKDRVSSLSLILKDQEKDQMKLDI